MIDIEYLFQGKLDNTVHEITYEQIGELLKDNEREEAEGKQKVLCKNSRLQELQGRIGTDSEGRRQME